MRHMSQYLTTQVSAKLYCYYIRPTLEYTSPGWHGSISSEQTLALKRVQASVARAILQADSMTPKSILLERLQWPALRWRREISSLVVFHKLITTRPSVSVGSFFLCIFENWQASTETVSASTLDGKFSSWSEIVLLPVCSSLNTLPHDIQCVKKKQILKCALETHWSEHNYCPYKNIDIT